MSRPESGVSILETLVAATIIGIVGYGMRQAYYSSYAVRYNINLKATQETIALDIESSLRSPTTIYASTRSLENLKLRDCLLGVGNGCQSNVTDPDKLTRFSLVFPVADTGDDIALSGTEDKNEVYYDIDGRRGCKKKDPMCLFTVRSYFYATCPATNNVTPTSCSWGYKAHFTYEVIPIPGKDFSQASEGVFPIRKFGKFPAQLRFVTIKVSQLLGPGADSNCPSHTRILGYDKQGIAKCECTLPWVRTQATPSEDKFKKPICVKNSDTPLLCPAGKSYRGVNADGTPKCFDTSDSYEVLQVSINSKTQIIGTCPTGYWVCNFKRTGCKLHCTSKKEGADCANFDGDSRALDGRDAQGNLLGLVCQENLIECCRQKKF